MGTFKDLVDSNKAGLQQGPHRAELIRVAEQNVGAAPVTEAVRMTADHVEQLGRAFEKLIGINLEMSEPGLRSPSMQRARNGNDTPALGV